MRPAGEHLPGLLIEAAAMVPSNAATEIGASVDDIREYTANGEWDTALGILTDLGDRFPAPMSYWELLTAAAKQMGLERDAAWCQWRHSESRSGVIRAELSLLATADGGRRSAIPGPGALRPLWDLGHRTPTGDPDLRIAVIWVEHTPDLPPGTVGIVRLLPLDPSAWHHLRPGQCITMHEGLPANGTAIIIETRAPTSPLPGSR